MKWPATESDKPFERLLGTSELHPHFAVAATEKFVCRKTMFFAPSKTEFICEKTAPPRILHVVHYMLVVWAFFEFWRSAGKEHERGNPSHQNIRSSIKALALAGSNKQQAREATLCSSASVEWDRLHYSFVVHVLFLVDQIPNYCNWWNLPSKNLVHIYSYSTVILCNGRTTAFYICCVYL